MKFLRGSKSCTMHDQIENKNMREKLNTFSVTQQAELVKATGKSTSKNRGRQRPPSIDTLQKEETPTDHVKDRNKARTHRKAWL